MPLPRTYDGKTRQDELILLKERNSWSYAQSTSDHAILLLSKNIQKLSDSNDKYAKAMNWLTAGILLVAFLQILIPFFRK